MKTAAVVIIGILLGVLALAVFAIHELNMTIVG